ncbi:hypothetical protein G6F31_015607 [Rhizopus arrhizus]|nr:hypothetical protein G6F31_015607 [Rhizopus arrhizus]
MGQYRDVRQAGFAQLAQRGRGLGHLHQREQAFLHACAAALREAYVRGADLDCGFGSQREALTDHRAHRAAHEGEVERRSHQRTPLEQAAHGDQRVVLAGVLLRDLDALAVFLLVLELEQVGRPQARTDLGGAVGVEQRRQPRARTDRHVMAALRADLQVLFQLRTVQRAAAVAALFPQALGDAALLAGGVVGADAGRHQLAEPTHAGGHFRSGRPGGRKGGQSSSAAPARAPLAVPGPAGKNHAGTYV